MKSNELKTLVEEVVRTVLNENKSTAKITRDAFLYLDPKGDGKNFAQCSTCRLWTEKTCLIMGKTPIKGSMSCGLYSHGTPQPELAGQEVSAVSPKEVGLVNRKVRCENCRSFDAKTSKCMLFQALNEQMGDKFNLDEKVKPQGCCNAQMPK
jgi:hypothetical protein